MGASRVKIVLMSIQVLIVCLLAVTLGTSEVVAFDSLMPGARPSSFSVPSGWKVYGTRSFEGETWAGCCEFVWSPIVTTQAHSGTHSTGGNIGTVQTGWGIESFPNREFYISFWEYLDSSFRNNDEMFVVQFLQRSPAFQEIIWEWYSNGEFNATVGAKMINIQGALDGGPAGQGYATIPVGAWHQWEVRMKSNTPGGTDGIVQVYLDGVLFASRSGNVNDGVDMTGGRLSIGGTYSKLIWRKADGSCGAFIGDGTTPPPTVCFDFTNCACPPNPPQPMNRYFDDIIVLIPSGSADTSPPNPPTGVTVR